MIKGTVSVISSGPPSKDVNIRFTTVPFKVLSECMNLISILIILKTDHFQL